MRKTLILTALAVVFAAPPALAEGGGEDGQGKGHHGGHKGGMFKAADTNNDGVITRDEFNAFHEKVFDRMDMNGDGKISRDEQQKRRAAWRDKMKGKMQNRRDER